MQKDSLSKVTAIKFKSPEEYSKNIITKGRDYLRNNPNQRFASVAQWLWSLLFLCFFCISYTMLIITPVGYVSILICFLVGLFSYVVIAAFCHDAAHGSLHKNNFINEFCLYLGFAIIGVNGQLWQYRHLNKHHPYPNVKGNDVDADSSLIIRLSPSNKWEKPHRFQAFYTPLLYGFVLPSVTWYEDFVYFKKAIIEKPKYYKNVTMFALFFGSKLIHILLFLVIPFLLMPISFFELLLGYFIIVSTGSFIFIMINVGSHITDLCVFSEPNANGEIESDWVTHQLRTSVDWSPTNTFFIALTGGANAHAAHHIFPNVAHCHNANLTKIVTSNLPSNTMHNKLTFFGMIAAHWRLLYKLSSSDYKHNLK